MKDEQYRRIMSLLWYILGTVSEEPPLKILCFVMAGFNLLADIIADIKELQQSKKPQDPQ